MSMYPPPPEDTSGGAAPYGQQPDPQYGQQPQYDYGQQQPPYDYGQVPPQPYYGVTPPPPKSRKGLKIALSIVAAVIVLVGGLVAYGVFKATDGMGDYKLVAPTSFQGLTRQDDNTVVKAMSGSAGSIAQNGATPLVTSYVSSATAKLPDLMVIGAYGKLPLASLQLSQFWSGITGDDAANTVTLKTSEDAGPLGGSMQCALVKIQGVYFPTCVWADNSTFSGVMDAAHLQSSTPDLPALAAKVRALRSAMEVKK